MADTMNFGPEWLRNLSGGSSGGFTNSHSSGGGGGTTGGSSNNIPSSLPLKLPTPTTPTAAYAKKFPLATHRYGREELLQMFSDDVPFPTDMPDFPPATRKQLLIPLSFMPVSEEEQLALSGGVNSESVYGVRGGRGGYYPMRGRPGRGRGRGEAGFLRTPSYEEFHHPWTATEGRGGPAYTPTGRGGSRALKDGNWRSPTTPIEISEEPLPNWGNHWHPPPSPGKAPPTIPRGGGTSGGREGNRTWQVLPEWASDDVITSSTVGTFDSSGMFTTPVDKAAKPPDEGSLQEPRGRQTSESEPPEAPPSSTSTSQPQDTNTSTSNSCNNRTNGTPGSLPLTNDTMKQPPPEFQHRRSKVREEFKRKVRESIEDPLQDGGGLPIPSQPPAPSAHVVQKPSPVQKPLPASIAAQTSGGGLLTTTPPTQVGSGSMLSDSINSVVNSSLLHSGGHVTSHMMSHDQDDSVFSPSSVNDDHMKHIEKAAEALLSTEEEETPTTSPTIPPPTSTLPITTAHTHPQSLPPPPYHQLPGIPPQMNPEDAHKWLYKDPQGEIQGPFPARDMKEWFDCGYFTMDLMVRRVCDGGMLPLGQVIRIWGRVPFTTSGQHPPPIRLNDPFWQRVFQQQQQLMLQKQQAILHLQKQQQPTPLGTTQSQAVGPRPPVVRGGPPQLPTPTTPTTMASESIWTRNTPKEVGDEDQWPDITGDTVWKSSPEPSPEKEKQCQQEEARRVKELERLAAKEKRQLEEERRRREEEERLKAQEERQRREEEAKAERQRQEKATRRRAEEEMKRREMEKQRLMEEEARMMQRLQEERQHLRQQEAEEERRMAMERQQALERQQWQQQALPWVSTPPGRPGAPSLLQIQQEEEVQAAHEQHRKEEMMRIHMQQNKQLLLQQQLGWGSGVRGGGSKPKSFLEIQLEQEGDAPKEMSGGGGSGGGAVSRPLKGKETSSWSTIAATKQPPPAWSPIAPIGSQKSKSLSISLDNEGDDEEEDELSFWNECARVAKKNPPRVVSNPPPPPPQSAPPQKKRTDREEENVRRLFSANSASDEFNKWCEQELKTFNTDVDAATFISFLLEVDSVYEVHDYIKSYLGETGEAHDFAKQFLERRQKLKRPSQQGSQSKKSKPRDRSGSHGSSDHSEIKGASGRQEGEWEEGGGGSRSSKKKKKKMQKVYPAAMLGFTVNAADRPNMGEIQSVHDVL